MRTLGMESIHMAKIEEHYTESYYLADELQCWGW